MESPVQGRHTPPPKVGGFLRVLRLNGANTFGGFLPRRPYIIDVSDKFIATRKASDPTERPAEAQPARPPGSDSARREDLAVVVPSPLRALSSMRRPRAVPLLPPSLWRQQCVSFDSYITVPSKRSGPAVCVSRIAAQVVAHALELPPVPRELRPVRRRQRRALAAVRAWAGR
jgi:hypothetical protein